MPAYIVSRVAIEDRDTMQRYMQMAPETVAKYGGKYLVRGSGVEALEGSWDHDRMVVVEFATREAALAWYHSDEYRPQRDMRQASAQAVILLADGAS